MQRFDTQNTGYNPDGTPLKGDIAVHATFDAPTGFSQDYLLEDGTAYIYNVEEGNVGAIDLETGSSKWVKTPTAEPTIPELIEGNILGARSFDGTVYGMNRDNGDIQSETSVGAGGSLGYTVDKQWLAPTADGTLIAGRGGEEDYEWTADIDGIGLRPAADGQRIYYPVIEGVDAENFRFENPTRMEGSGRLYAIDSRDGSILWDVSHDRFGIRSPVVADGTICWATADGTVTAYDAENGDEQWQFTADRGFNAPLAVRGNTVLAGNDDGRLYGIALDSGEQIGAAEVDGRVRSPPVVLDDTVFFGTDNKTAYAFDLESSEILWEFETQGAIRTLTAGDNRVVVGTLKKSYIIGPTDEVPSDSEKSSEKELSGEDTTDDESQTNRGFLTNDSDSSLSVLDDPVTLTWAGIGVSIVGIVMQLFGQQT